MTRKRPTPLGAVFGGMVAGAIGTAAMDAVWYRRYRAGGGEQGFAAWELSEGLDSWEDAAAPARFGKRLWEGVFQEELPDERARLANNLVHWATGVGYGGLFGVLAGSARRRRRRWGIPFGAAVWVNSYVVLGRAGLYRSMWDYDARTLWKDLSAHLAYGLATAAAFRALAGPGDPVS
ncbi:MAG: hypothetical protein HY658_07550 [Actinobacteria bacterium]|nr:hypothetical protein [Actinomycetota bacterium]